MDNGSNNGSNGNGHNGNGKHRSLFEFAENLFIPQEVDEFSKKTAADKTLINLLIKNELFDSDGSSDASTGNFRKRPARYEHPLWSLGWTDGRLGQPRETNEALLLARGKLRRETRFQAMKAKLSLNEARLPDLQLQVARVRELLGEATSHYTNIVKERAGRFHDFSYFLGAFYIGIAALLFFSDIPLTLKLVAKGFDLDTDVKDPKTGQIMFGVEQLLVNRWTVISHFWEPLTLALGIALGGVIFKIVLDEVIFRDQGEVRKKRAWTLSVIGVAFVITMGVLGYFRSQVQNTIQNNLAEKRAVLARQLKKQGLPDAEIKIQVDQLQAEPESRAETTTFVLLTVMLPLVAGVCFSAGWRRLKDTHRYRQLRREIKKLEQKLGVASSALHSALADVESAKTWLKVNFEDPKAIEVDAETQQELSLYRHGYFRGMNVPETIDHGLPLYDRVQRSAQKILAKKVKERMWSDV